MSPQPSYRMPKVDETIRHAVGDFLTRELELPLDCLVTVVGVSTAADLSHCTITISVLPFDRHHEIIKTLGRERGHLRHYLARHVILRRTPDVHFEIDQSQERKAAIDAVLDNLNHPTV